VSDSLRVVFAGTPQFSVPALEALSRSRHHLVGAITRPDTPAGRGRQLSESAVSAAARRLGLSVSKPQTLRSPEAVSALAGQAPDVIVVAAYGLLLPDEILRLPRQGCINIHASLLPRWRGAAPIQRALLAGDAESGVSIMHMERTLDTGPVYARRSVHIEPQDTSVSLHERLARLGAEALLEVLEAVSAGAAVTQPQIGPATYAARIEKSEALVDWSQAAAQIERQVRAFDPWPIAETLWRGQKLRIWTAHVVPLPRAARPGTVLASDVPTIVVACGEGALALDVIQLPGRKPLPAHEFLQGHALHGDVLG
jgi:methionyl-tRNA formyltransferase